MADGGHVRLVGAAKRRVHVYVAIWEGRMKIGASSDPVRRVASFATCCPGILLVAHWRSSFQEERELHARLADEALGGEWFTITPATLGGIANHLSERRDEYAVHAEFFQTSHDDVAALPLFAEEDVA